MVRASLRVIFQYKDDSVLPKGALRQGLHDPAQCQVIVRHIGPRRKITGAPTSRVITGQMQYFEGRHLAFDNELMKFLYPSVSALLIGNLQVKFRIDGAHVSPQITLRDRPAVGAFDPVTVIAKPDSVLR